MRWDYGIRKWTTAGREGKERENEAYKEWMSSSPSSIGKIPPPSLHLPPFLPPWPAVVAVFMQRPALERTESGFDAEQTVGRLFH